MPTAIDLGKVTPKRGTWTVVPYQVTAAQTFRVGDWVAMTDAGTISVAVAPGSDVASATQLLGRARANAVDCLALSIECPVEIPGADGEFLATVTADDASANLALTDFGSADGLLATYGVRHLGADQTTSKWTINKSETTDKKWVITQRHPKYAFGETYGWFWCRLHTDQAATTAAT